MPDTPDKAPSADWIIFGATDAAKRKTGQLPAAPPWRSFAPKKAGAFLPYVTTDAIDQAVNAALYLRRPLLVTGGPGTGKSSLAREVARQLGAERFLKWPINSKSTLADALYRYDAIGRLRDANLASLRRPEAAAAPAVVALNEDPTDARYEDIGNYLSLGPLGTALIPPGDNPGGRSMRVLLVDEIDKSDLDLPNDLLDVLEDGQFVIPELQRIAATYRSRKVGLDSGDRRNDPESALRAEVTAGSVQVAPDSYPFILITSNGERDFSPAFLRRCVRLELGELDPLRAQAILTAQLGELPDDVKTRVDVLVNELLGKGEGSRHAVDQLLNLAWLLTAGRLPTDEDKLINDLKGVVARSLDA